MQQLKTYFLLTFIFCAVFSLAQNQNKKWYFGYGCALDFMTNPPTILNNSAMNVGEGCASIADNAGNLLFYTDGSTIYNAAHTTMANGTGLIGGSSPVQAALIIKQPGNSTIYYVFTVDETFNLGFYYSIVDMSLATGIGSVTVKNTSLLNSSQGFEKLSATRHANGTDFWIMTQPRNSSSYYAYLLTATGLNTTAVVSSIGSAYNASGCIKFSPDGQKLASAWLFQPIELYDFNATTGAVSNSLILNLAIGHNGYGCEFSPDGTKLYGAGVGNLNNLMQIVQWDLSAGSNMAILSSSVSISNPTLSTGSMQLAPDGKIYIANSLVTNNSWHNIHVINNPNVAGAGCNFFAFGQPVSAFNVTQNTISHSSIGLPNQIYIPCLTFTASGSNITTCYGASTGSASILAVSGNSGTPTYTWTNGTSTLNTQNINNVSAGAWTVTVDDTTGCPSQSVVTITQPPAITVNLSSSSTSICVGGGVLLTANASGGTGSSLTYSWSSGANFSVGIVTQTLAGTHIYTANVTDANNCTESKTISINYIANPPLTALPNQTICAGQSATLSTSGAIGYTWQPSGANTNSIVVSPTVPITIYTLSATNNTCGITSTVSVNYYDYPVLSVSPNQTICTNQSATLNASGASVFTWQPNSIVSNSIVVSLTVPITIYTVTATNNICATSETVQVSFYSNPTLTITPTQSICPTFTSNLTVSGANTYTWLPNNTVSNAITVSPPSTSIYSVTGTGIGGCQSTETTQVFVFPLPTFTFNTYTITCANLGSATVTPSGGYGAYNYTWQPTNQNGAVAVGLSPNIYTITAYDIGTGCYKDSIVTFSSLIPLTGNLHNQNTLKCNSVNTGTAYFSNLSGGSGNENYFWNNGSVMHTNASPNNLSAGNWSVTVADALTGCQIFSVFTITQPPALTLNVASTDLNICTGYNFTLSANASGGVGAYSYSWLSAPASGSQFTVTPSNAGVHTFTANAYDYNNCFITTTINVNVVSPPSLTISLSSPSMCAQAFSGSANTITLTSSGANSYTLQTPNQISSTHSLNPVSELNSQPPYQPAGATTATLFGSNGICIVSTTANFSVIPNPTVSVNNHTPVICAGQSYTYTSQGASSYTWSSSTPNSTLYTYGNIAVTNPSINSVFAVVGGSLGCYSPIVTTSITVNPIPEVFVTPSNTYVCMGQSIPLTASGTNGNSYAWFPNKDLDQNTGSVVFASPQTQQTYTVIASLNNCTNAAVTKVSIKPLPNPQIQIIKNGACVNDSIILKGSGGMAYQWIAPNGQTLWGFEELRIKANHESFSGNYTLTVYDFYSCANSKTQSIMINPLPTGFVKAQNLEGCVPLCNEYVFVPSNSATQLMSVSWNMNNKNFSGNKLNYCLNTAGTHTIQVNVRDENSCANSIVTHVLVYPQPTADFSYTPTQPIESLDEVQFINTSKNAEKFEWNISVINQTSQEKNTSVLFENTGTYVVALTAQNDKQCLDTAIKSIYVLPDFTIFVPNIFTPNGDNLNETFKPVIRGQKEYRFQIFNRWGQKIFESTNVNQGWDGTFKGEPAKADSYVWKITVVNAKEEKVLNGTVSLER